MHKLKGISFLDSWIMFKRCLLISLRNPEALLMATITPFFLMLLFGTVFGNIADVGSLNYIDFIVPGIIMQSLGQASQTLGNERRNRYDKRHNRPFPFYVNFKICRTDRSYWRGSSEKYNFKHRNHYYCLCPWFSAT